MDFNSITVSDRHEGHPDVGDIHVYFRVPVDHWLARQWHGDPDLAKGAVEYTLCLEYDRGRRIAGYCDVMISPTCEVDGGLSDVDYVFCGLSLGMIAKLLQIEEQWLAERQTAKGV